VIHDIVIAGAGPAGAHLAYRLAQNGFRPVLLDACRFPRKKVCAGGLTSRALLELGRDAALPLQRKITAACLTWRNRGTIQEELGEPGGATVLREEFDTYLVDRAAALGAVFFPGRAFLDVRFKGDLLEVETSDGPLRARRLIGADGARSRVRRRVFGAGTVRLMPALAARVQIPGEAMDRLGARWVIDYGGMRGGYGWLFPMKDHVCTGVGTTFRGGDLKKAHQAFMESYDCLHGGRILDLRCSCIPVGGRAEILQKDNVWLIGDAAGLAEPFYGEGLFYAFRSASLAAQALAEGAGDPRAESYRDRVAREILPELDGCRMLARCFYLAPRLGFSLGIRNRFFRARARSARAAGRIGGILLFWAALSIPFGLMGLRHPGAVEGRL